MNFKTFKPDKQFSNEFIDLLDKEQLVLRKIPKIKNIQYHYYNNKGYNVVNLNGNGGEVIRVREECFNCNMMFEDFEQFFTKNNINPIFKDEMKIWYEDVNKWAKKYNLNIMDLAYWEQRMGLWGGWYPSEQDIAINEITPFNNRELMFLFMKIDIQQRQSPDFIIFKKIIMKTWPELLEIPINKDNKILNKLNRIYCKLLIK